MYDRLMRLTNAKQRLADVQSEVEAHVANIEQVRHDLGNPYFFSPRPADHSESQSKFTGYASHEPGLALIREWQIVREEIAEIQNRLQENEA